MKKIVISLLAVMLCAVCAFASAEQSGYVLMNIPYNVFYAPEVTDASGMDAVTSATRMKTRTMALAGGSYHVDPEGSDISGVTWPVYVEDMSVLSAMGGIEITDESSVSITVTNRGQESTTVYTGKDALFEAPDYSWYVLSDAPAAYKTLNAYGSFSALTAESVALSGDAAIFYDHHTDVAIQISGVDEALSGKTVSAAVLVLADGTRVGLRHVAELWRNTQIGFSFDSNTGAAVMGKRITGIELITADAVYAVSLELDIPDDELLLKLSGTYTELFPEFAREEYKDYWLECIKAYVAEDEAAEMVYQMLIGSCMGTLKGQEAVDAYTADPDSAVFNCFFENGVGKLTVNGSVISGTDAEGNVLFSHAYRYAMDVPCVYYGQPIGVSFHVYVTDDADAGVFTCFAFLDDTIGETYHIEFRYGEDPEAVGNYTEGECAFWMPSGINDGYKESQIKACIKLFVDENAGGEED